MVIFFGLILTVGLISVVILAVFPQNQDKGSHLRPFFGSSGLKTRLGLLAESSSSAYRELSIKVHLNPIDDVQRGDRVYFKTKNNNENKIERQFEVCAITDASRKSMINATYDRAKSCYAQLLLRPLISDQSADEIMAEKEAPHGCEVWRDRDNGFTNLINALRAGAVSFVNPRLLVFKYRVFLAIFIASLTYITIAFMTIFLQLQVRFFQRLKLLDTDSFT